MFPLNPQKVKLLAGGSTATKTMDGTRLLRRSCGTPLAGAVLPEVQSITNFEQTPQLDGPRGVWCGWSASRRTATTATAQHLHQLSQRPRRTKLRTAPGKLQGLISCCTPWSTAGPDCRRQAPQREGRTLRFTRGGDTSAQANLIYALS